MESDSNPLSAFADILPGTSPKGQDINSLGLGLPFFQGAKEFGALNPTAERFTERPVRTALKGDILVSVRAPVGRINIADSDCAIGRGVMAVRPKEGDHADFLFYVLRGMEGKWGTHGTTGSVFESLSTAGLKELPVPVIKASKIVGAILASLDEKIRLNTEMSKTLEAIAQTIFKSWFIDFDPVHAKMRGEKPEGMDDATAALFPDSFDESELGMIPNGWDVTKVGNHFSFSYGKALKSENRQPGQVMVFGSNGIVGTHNEALLDDPSIVIGRKGTVGTVTVTLNPSWPIDTTFFVQTPNERDIFFAYLVLRGLGMERMNSDTGVPGLNRRLAHDIRFVFPSREVIDAFTGAICSHFELISEFSSQSTMLVTIRDALLPRLISGKLEIPDEMLAS